MARAHLGSPAGDLAREGGVDDGLAPSDLLQDPDDVLGGSPLQHVALGTGPQCLEHVLLVLVHREEDHGQVGVLLGDDPAGFQPRLPLEAHVEQHRIRCVLVDLGQGSRQVGGLADDFNLRVTQHRPETRPHHLVVVDDEDTDALARTWGRRRGRTRTGARPRRPRHAAPSLALI